MDDRSLSNPTIFPYPPMSFDHELSYSDLQEISGLDSSFRQQTPITPTPDHHHGLPCRVPQGHGCHPLAEWPAVPVFRPGTPVPPMLPLSDHPATTASFIIRPHVTIDFNHIPQVPRSMLGLRRTIGSSVFGISISRIWFWLGRQWNK